jgi:type II secretion system protein D
LSGGTAEYQVYTLRHKQAAEVEKMLTQILPGLGTTTQLAADPRANQILLRGPESAHQAARQLIQSVDHAEPATVASPAIVRMYPCPADRQAEVTTRLQAQWANRDDVRVASNTHAGQLFVLAPPEIHDTIARQLAASAVPAAPMAQPAPAMPMAPAIPAPAASPAAPFVGLTQVRVEQIEGVLFQLLGSRLVAMPNPLPNGAQYVFIDASGKRLELAIDRTRNGITVIGAEPLVGQFVRLVHHLDQPASPGKTQRIVPVHRADPAKVEQAVKAYRTGGRDEGSMSPKGGSGSNDTQLRGAIGLVGYMFQPADAAQGSAVQPAVGTAATAATPVVPATTSGVPVPLRNVASDVEVEVLPDLDVIILRGREQDVAELTRIIEELERLSAETQPMIEVCPLQHVGGDALTALIARVQDSLLGGLQGRVSITPLGKPNALLLIGWGDAVRAAKELITRLDQPVAADSQFKVFPLKHAPANTARTTVQEIFASRTGLASRVQVSADVRTNSLLVQASPRDLVEAEAIIQNLDRGESASIHQTRIYKLKNTLATDLATTIQAAIAASRGSTTSTATTAAATAAGGKSSTLELVTVDPTGRKVLKSGILADVQITADPHLNTLIISAPAESIELVVALIQQLDVPVATAQIKVFRIINGDASSLVMMLRSLLLRPESAGTTTAAPLPLSQDESTLAPLRFSVDTRTNCIIAVGGSSDLRIVEALLLRLDQQDVAERRNAVYRLKNAPALDVATAINEFLRSERQLHQSGTGLTSASQQMESEVVVVPEQVSNALIVSATPRYYQKIADLIEKLDEQPPQVLIQVVIAEVKLGNYDEFGLELGLQDSVLFDRGVLSDIVTTTSTITNASGTAIGNNQTIQSATTTPGYNFNNGNALGNSGTASSSSHLVGGQSISNFGVGRNSSKTGYSGLVLSASSESVSVLLRAMQELSCMRVISRPQIMTLDNQPAYVQVGQRVPRITGSAINNVGQMNTVALENVGIILGVTPRISPEGLVVMEVDAEKSEIDTTTNGTEVAISQGEPIYSPYVNVTTAQTTVSASSGQTIIMGGLITKNNEQIDRRVPWLADIPVLGYLFRYKSNYMDRKELLIILTPHVVRNKADEERVRQLETSRMHWCLRDMQQIHGDMGDSAPQNVPTVYPDTNPRGIVSDEPQPISEASKPAEPVFPPVPKSPESK